MSVRGFPRHFNKDKRPGSAAGEAWMLRRSSVTSGSARLQIRLRAQRGISGPPSHFAEIWERPNQEDRPHWVLLRRRRRTGTRPRAFGRELRESGANPTEWRNGSVERFRSHWDFFVTSYIRATLAVMRTVGFAHNSRNSRPYSPPIQHGEERKTSDTPLSPPLDGRLCRTDLSEVIT
jgi:hypothetical protein